MNRSITTHADSLSGIPNLAPTGAPPPPPPPDTYKDKLLKYIPGEVVALYLGLAAIVGATPQPPGWLSWAILLVGVVATPLYLRRALRVTKSLQLAISTVAFVVWVFALGGPFKDLDWYRPVYGGVLLPVFTFFVAFVDP